METIEIILTFLSFMLLIMVLLYVHKTQRQMRELELARNQAKQAMVEARNAQDEADHARLEAEAARAEAEAANRAKTDFLSTMSHNIRTPLNAIIGMTVIADEHKDDPAKIEDCLKKIEGSGRHLLGIVNDVLDMSKIEGGKFSLHVRAVSLRESLETVHDMMRVDLADKQQQFELQVDKLISEWVYCDGDRLDQILLNLLSNASKYTPVGGTISLTLSQEISHKGKGYVRNHLTVRDTGIGMSEEFQERLFHVHEPEETHHVYEVQGTGLGLALTKYIVDAMEGTLDVKSAPQKGTEFYVTVDFEMVQEEKTARSAQEFGHGKPGAYGAYGDEDNSGEDYFVHSDVWLEGMSILLVEDNAINAELASTILEDKGAFVEIAENGKIAYDRFAESAEGYYDLILMDLRMPVMNGLETTKAIRAMERGDAVTIPIIAMTADAFEEDIRNCLDAGMNGHLSKPIDVAKLTRTLTKYLRFLG